jgi:hypothetical protein
VLLKTANYPNKTIVAYATILSSSPKENVGGVEIGKQFYKVPINPPTVQDEPLVRPIAWPLIYVCYDYLSKYFTTTFY